VDSVIIAEDKFSFGDLITKNDTEAVIRRQLNLEKFPIDTNGIYIVISSQEVSHRIQGQKSCRDYCG
jgi:hypothetical protein